MQHPGLSPYEDPVSLRPAFTAYRDSIWRTPDTETQTASHTDNVLDVLMERLGRGSAGSQLRTVSREEAQQALEEVYGRR